MDGTSPPSAGPSRPRRAFRAGASPDVRAVALSGLLAGVAVLVFVHGVRDLPALPAPFHLNALIVALTFAGGEACAMHLQFRREVHTISLTEIPIVLGLLYARPSDMVAGAILGAALTLTIHRRQRPLKLAFNLSHLTLEIGAAIVVFRVLLLAGAGAGPGMWGAAMAAGLTADAIAMVSVSLVILVHQGRFEPRQIPQVLGVSLAVGVANTTLGVVTAMLLWVDLRAVTLVAVVAVVVAFAYRGYAGLIERHASLELLYDFTRAVGRATRAEDVVLAVLSQARELLRCEFSAVCFVGEDGRILHRMILSGDEPLVTCDDPHPIDSLYAYIRGADTALAIGRGTKDPRERALLTAAGMTDVVVTALQGDRTTAGFLCVADRMGPVSTFGADDARLFETIAIHAGVALENGRLVDRLRHEALHDSLTGLPNRAMFHDQVTRSLADHPTGPAAVLLMDLDRFKDINDSLGHHAGDVVLQQVATRLRDVLGPGPVIARLGGDEFAVLIRGANAATAMRAAAAIRGTFERPFHRDDLTLDIGATIGIAVHPEHGADSSTLLRRADVAMYAAKGQQPGYAMYSLEFDDASPRRLALVGELRQGIASGQLVLHYQPKASLATGEVIGVETLVRWQHPVQGLVYPDDFIPLAERTGLIGPLTGVVLEQALAQCRVWLDHGLRLPVAVNLSARSLVDLDLPAELGRLLQRTRVPAGALTVEVTESSVMSDPGRTIAVLHRLREMGISISVDDFGTGYSSLSYLKRLPVNEVKIDKSFVINMTRDANDATIVRSIIDLGRNLGLRVVAEGVENREIWDELADLGCEVAQGYHLSRPMPAEEVEDWVRLTSRFPSFL